MEGTAHDVLTVCHPATLFGSAALGWAVGLLQFLPWLLGPLIFVNGAFAWTWRREVFATLVLLVDKVLFVLMVGAQIRLDIGVPDLSCTDIFGTLHGFPCVAAVRLGLYLGVGLILHRWLWLRSGGHVRPSWMTLATLLVVPLLIATGLIGSGLNTPVQVLGSLGIGLAVAALLMLLVRTLLYPYAIRPYVVAANPSAAASTSLQRQQHNQQQQQQQQCPQPALLTTLFGAHDRLLQKALDDG